MINASLSSSEADGPLTTADIVFAVIYSLIVLPGIVGNSIIITIVWKNSSMHTTTNYLLMNLAVAEKKKNLLIHETNSPYAPISARNSIFVIHDFKQLKTEDKMRKLLREVIPN